MMKLGACGGAPGIWSSRDVMELQGADGVPGMQCSSEHGAPRSCAGSVGAAMGVPQAPAHPCRVRASRAAVPPGVRVCPAVPQYRPVCGCVPWGRGQRWAGVSGHYPRSALLISDVQDAGQQRGEGGALLRLLWRERGAWLELVSAPAVPWGSPSPCQDGRRCHRG